MPVKSLKPFASLEHEVGAAVRRAGGAACPAIDGVAEAVFASLKGAGRMGDALRDAMGLITGAVVRGGREAPGYAARGFATGLLRAAGWRGERAKELVTVAAGSFLTHARAAGADAVEVSRGLVEGVIVWAEEAGEDACGAASAAARAAISAAGAGSSTAAREVHDAVKDGVAGVEVVLL